MLELRNNREPVARLNKRRLSVDRLALPAGIQRPDVLRDPLHFKLSIGRARRSQRGAKRAGVGAIFVR